MTEITAAKTTIDSCTIHYLSAGNTGNKPVVLLHGMKFTASTWQELGTLEHLAAQGFHAVALDMPGFGKSPACPLQPDTVLQGFFRQTGLAGTVLVGPSMGGRTVLEYALDHPDDAAGLVLIGPVGVEENRDRLSSIRMPALIVWGSEDAVSSTEYADVLQQAIKRSKKIIIDGASHPCYLDNPERWHAELTDFLHSLAG